MLLGILQENLICLLAYNEKYANIVRWSVDLSLFGGPYRVLSARIYDYLDRYKKPPKDHLADLLSDKLDPSKPEAKLFTDIIDSIHGAQEGINAEYVIGQLETFIKRQSLRSITVDLTKALQRDTEESLEEADALIKKANHQTLSIFDPGTRLSDKTKSLSFLDNINEAFPTGIAELDRRGFGPTRKELWLLVANTKSGKSWALMHMAKMALSHRLRVCHITLEMSEGKCSQRYFQALFGVAKRKEAFRTTKFTKDELGRVIGFNDVKLTPKLTLQDENIKAALENIIDKWSVRRLDNIFIKQFPTGMLTVPQLECYLENLGSTQSFTPDLLIVDYPDLMKLDKGNLRLSLDEVYKDLRGLAVKRNIALAVVSQSHRAAAKAKVVGGENVAEAYSKIAHADVVLTLSSTEAEKKLGLARLSVVAGRNDADNLSIVISQQFGVGSFIVDYVVLTDGYWQHLNLSEGANEN